VAIGERTRKRLWARSNNTCAFPGCGEPLLHPVEGQDEDTIVGKECHIVAQKDSHWRGVDTLTDDEKEAFAALIEDRDGFRNLILLCGVHHDVIDDKNQGLRVGDVVKMKRDHEATASAARTPAQRRRDEIELRYAAIVDEWARRVELDDWQARMSGLLWGDWPQMRLDTQTRLRECAAWLFGRVWPGELERLGA